MSKTIEQIIEGISENNEFFHTQDIPHIEKPLNQLLADLKKHGLKDESMIKFMLIQKLETIRYQEILKWFQGEPKNTVDRTNSLSYIDGIAHLIKQFGGIPVFYDKILNGKPTMGVTEPFSPKASLKNCLYMLFVERGTPPQVIEGTLEEAILEAKNLSKNKDRKITVLKSVYEVTQRIDFEVRHIDN